VNSSATYDTDEGLRNTEDEVSILDIIQHEETSPGVRDSRIGNLERYCGFDSGRK
jgi:hypothetical protein